MSRVFASSSSRRAWPLAVLLLTLSLRADSAHATSSYWRSAVSGSASVAGNWNPAVIPGAADLAGFTLTGLYTASWASPQDTLGTLDVNTGTPALSIAGNLGVRNAAIVEDGGFLTISSGRVRANQWLVGHLGSGRLIVTGAGSQAVSVSSNAPTMFAETTSTSASVAIVGEGQFISNSWYELGHHVFSTTCSLLVAGGNVITRIGSRLSTLSSAGGGDRGGLIVGVNGPAYVDIYNGGFVDLKGPLVVGRRGNATMRLYKTGGILVPGMNVGGNTYIGYEPSTLLAHPGLLSLEAGLVRLGGGVLIGDPDHTSGNADQGTLRVQGSSVIVGGPIQMPPSLAGTLELRSGTLQMLSGLSAIQQSVPFAVSSSVGSPTMWLEPGAFALVKPASGSTIALGVGRGGAGRVRIAGTNARMDAAGEIAIADSAGGTGIVEVDSSGVLNASSGLIEGTGGSISIRGGGQLNVPTTLLAMGTIQMHDGIFDCPWGVLGQPATLTGSGTLVGRWDNLGSVVIPASEILSVSGTFNSVVGTVSGGGTLEMTPGSVLQAIGTKEGSIVMMSSELRPYTITDAPQAGAHRARPSANAIEGVPIAPPGRLHVIDDLNMIDACITTVRIDSQASGLRDTLEVGGEAALSGVLNLLTISGSEPVAGDTITIIEAASVTGEFSGGIRLDGVDPAGAVTLEYTPTRVRVIFLGSALGVGDDPRLRETAMALRLWAVRTPGTAAFTLELPERARVLLTVFDVSGREVSRLADDVLESGRHRFTLRPGRLASGVYFARAQIEAPGGTIVKRTRVAVLR